MVAYMVLVESLDKYDKMRNNEKYKMEWKNAREVRTVQKA